MAVWTEQGYDNYQIRAMALEIQHRSDLDEAAINYRARRMQKLFERSQIGTTILMGGQIIGEPEAEEPSFMPWQQLTVQEAGKLGLTVTDVKGNSAVLDYKTLRLPIISAAEAA